MIPGGLYLADTSAVLYSARGPAEYTEIARRRVVGFTDLPLHDEIARRARWVQAELARRSQHRAAGVVDLLTAAIAERHAAVLLHYDRDFDHIAEVTGQQTRWVVAAGSAG